MDPRDRGRGCSFCTEFSWLQLIPKKGENRFVWNFDGVVMMEDAIGSFEEIRSPIGFQGKVSRSRSKNQPLGELSLRPLKRSRTTRVLGY
jgi:hypothetical protein